MKWYNSIDNTHRPMQSSRPAENLRMKSPETQKEVSLMLVVRDLFGYA